MGVFKAIWVVLAQTGGKPELDPVQEPGGDCRDHPEALKTQPLGALQSNSIHASGLWDDGEHCSLNPVWDALSGRQGTSVPRGR